MSGIARKAWQTRKGRERRSKAFKVEREAKTFAKKALNQKWGYRTVSFETRTGHEGTGIVDVVAVRRAPGDRDTLEVLLVQVKGGDSRMGESDLQRLRNSAKRLRAGYTVATKRGQTLAFNPPPPGAAD